MRTYIYIYIIHLESGIEAGAGWRASPRSRPQRVRCILRARNVTVNFGALGLRVYLDLKEPNLLGFLIILALP